MTPSTTSIDPVARLGQLLAADGIAAHDAAVADLVAVARCLGMVGRGAVAVEVLADPAEAEVARLRAFAVVARALAVDAPDAPSGPRFAFAA